MTALEDINPPGRGPSGDHAAPAAERPAAPATRADHRDAWERLVDVFEQAADEPRIAEPIGRIEHTVLLRSLDLDDPGILLDCHGGRMEVRDADAGRSDATIELALRTPDITKLAAGDLRTAMAIADGRATFGGPVRQFLRVLPLVQAMVNPPVAMGTNTDAVQEIV